MLANFFGKSKPVNFILIIALFLGYYILELFLYGFSTSTMKDILVLPLFLVLFFLFNFVISKNKLTKDNSYAFLLLVVGLGFLPRIYLDYTFVVSYIVLFLFFRRIYSLRTLKEVLAKLFDSGFWLGVLFLMSPAYLCFFLLLYSAILLSVKTNIKMLLIPILGFVTPVLLFFTYHFFRNEIESFYKLFDFEFWGDFSSYNSTNFLIVFLLFGITTFVSLFFKTGKIFSVSNKFKRSWILLILHLLIAICSLFLVSEKDGSEVFGILIPSTIIIANWLQSIERRLIVNVVLLLFIVTSFVIHFIA